MDRFVKYGKITFHLDSFSKNARESLKLNGSERQWRAKFRNESARFLKLMDRWGVGQMIQESHPLAHTCSSGGCGWRGPSNPEPIPTPKDPVCPLWVASPV